MAAGKKDVSPPAVVKPKKRPAERKPDAPAPVPDVRDDRGVGLSGG